MSRLYRHLLYLPFNLCLLTIFLTELKAAPVETHKGTAEAPVEHGDATMRRMARDMQALQAFVYKHLGSEEAPADAIKDMPKDAASLLFDKVMSLQTQVAKLTSRVEEVEFKFQQAQKDAQVDKKFLEERVAQLESRLAGGGGEATTPPPSPEDLSPDQLYEEAQRLMKINQVPQAEKHLRHIYENFPDSAIFTKACLDLVIMAEAQGKDAEAAAFAMAIYKKHPTSPEAQQALLKMAKLLHKLKQPEEACSVVNKLLTTPHLKPEFESLGKSLKTEFKCS